MNSQHTYHRTFSFLLSLLFAGVLLLAIVAFTAGSAAVVAAPVQSDCYATADGGTTMFGPSSDASALRDAVAAASPGGEVWVAGTCAGAAEAGGSSQVVLLEKGLALIGYRQAGGNWEYDPQEQTILDAEGNGRVVRIVGNVEVLLQNLRLVNGQSSGAAFDGGGVTAPAATLTISNSVFFSNTAAGSGAGGGLYSGGALTVRNTDFLSNTAHSGGGLSARGPAQVTGGRFENNQSGTQGGALSTYRDLTITGTRFVANEAAGRGGGALLSRGAGDDVLVLTNAHFEHNRCTYSLGCAGGAVYAYNPVIMKGSTFVGNRTSGSGLSSGGGAIYALAEMEIEGSRFEANMTPAHGGAIYVQAPATIRNSEIVSNVADRNGGGIWNSDTLVVIQAMLAENRTEGARYRGGAIYNAGSLSLLASDLISNTAPNAGAVFNTSDAAATIGERTLFRANEATGSFGSGGALANQGQLEVADSVFEMNRANDDGGAIDNDSGTLTATQVVFRDNEADGGGALSSSNNAYIENAEFTGNAANGMPDEWDEPGGGAIRVGFGSLWIADSLVRDNRAAYRGGGFYNSSAFSKLYLVNTAVSGNEADAGGGFYLLNEASIEASRVYSNQARVGGGMAIPGESEILLQNNFIAGNRATEAGDAVYVNELGESAATVEAIHNSFADGGEGTSSGTAVETAESGPGHELVLTNNIVSGYAVGVSLGAMTDTATIRGILWHQVGVNSTGGTVTVSEAYTGDPAFVAPESGDFHIQPGSAALERGVATPVEWDIDFEERPQRSAPDLGADELQFESPGIGNRVWEDANGNGLQDVGVQGIPESGLGGVTVKLVDAVGNVISTTVTNPAGYYFFAVDSASEYQLQFAAPPGYRFSPANVGANDEVDSDAQPGSGLTERFSFDGQTIDRSWDAGLSQLPPELYIEKESSALFVDPGETFTFTLTFGNEGTGMVNNVVISDALPTTLFTGISYEAYGVEVTPTTGVTFTWEVAALPAGTEGTIVIRGTVPDGVSANTPIENTATIAGSTGEGVPVESSASVTATVADADPIAVDDSGPAFTTRAGRAFTTGSVLANDREPNGDPLTVASVQSATLQGELVYNGDGTFTYDPAGAFANLAMGASATDTFSYTVSDPGGNTDTATVTIRVRGQGEIIYLPAMFKD